MLHAGCILKPLWLMAVVVDKLQCQNSHSGSNVKVHDNIDGHTKKSRGFPCLN